MKYLVVTERTDNELMDMINLYIATGWKPQGGMSVASDDCGTIYAQAMIKDN